MTAALYEMGWNDLAGNLARATKCSTEEKQEWSRRLINGEIKMVRSEGDYIQGAKEAAQTFLDGGDMTFKGPEWVVDDMAAKCLS